LSEPSAPTTTLWCVSAGSALAVGSVGMVVTSFPVVLLSSFPVVLPSSWSRSGS
jgi:hypothetical protein